MPISNIINISTHANEKKHVFANGKKSSAARQRRRRQRKKTLQQFRNAIKFYLLIFF